jgi:hypothetical protein
MCIVPLILCSRSLGLARSLILCFRHFLTKLQSWWWNSDCDSETDCHSSTFFPRFRTNQFNDIFIQFKNDSSWFWSTWSMTFLIRTIRDVAPNGHDAPQAENTNSKENSLDNKEKSVQKWNTRWNSENMERKKDTSPKRLSRITIQMVGKRAEERIKMTVEGRMISTIYKKAENSKNEWQFLL